MKKHFAIFFTLATLLILVGTASAEEGEVCIKCHRAVTPLLVKDWQSSEHSDNDVTCSVCHGSKHKSKKTAHLAKMPTEAICAEQIYITPPFHPGRWR